MEQNYYAYQNQNQYAYGQEQYAQTASQGYPGYEQGFYAQTQAYGKDFTQRFQQGQDFVNQQQAFAASAGGYAQAGAAQTAYQAAPQPTAAYDYTQAYAAQSYMPEQGQAAYAAYANPAYPTQDTEEGGFKGILTKVKSMPRKIAGSVQKIYEKISGKQQTVPGSMHEGYAPPYTANTGAAPSYTPEHTAPAYIQTPQGYAYPQDAPAAQPLQQEYTKAETSAPEMIYPTTEIIITQSASDCPDMIRRLNTPFISIVNMEELPEDEYRISYNILLGAKLALRYNLFKCGRGIFLLAPSQVSIGMNEVTRGIVEKLSRDNMPYTMPMRTATRYQEYDRRNYNQAGNYSYYR